jgi:hypothetical protein
MDLYRHTGTQAGNIFLFTVHCNAHRNTLGDFTKLPVALSGEMALNSTPVAGEILSTSFKRFAVQRIDGESYRLTG